MATSFRGIKLKMTTAIVAAVLGTAIVLTVITSVLITYTFGESLKALQKTKTTDNPLSTIEVFSGRVAFVSAVPIKRYGEQTLGYLVMARVWDDQSLAQLKAASGADLFVVRNGGAVLSTCALDR